MKRSIALALAMALLLCGCSMSGPEEFYQLPRASEEYQSLEACLKQQEDAGMEYAAPVSGSNTQPVLVRDLDEDGTDEAVAFFRDTAGGDNALKIFFYRQDEEGEYYAYATIEGSGSAINSVLFTQLTGDTSGTEEVVVSWQMSSSVYALTAYSLEGGAAVQILDGINYARYSSVDLDQDGISELVLFQTSASDTTSREAQYYTAQDGYMTLTSTVALSLRMAAIDAVHTGSLSDGAVALFVTGTAEDSRTGEPDSNYQLTDILTLRDGNLISLAMNESGDSPTLRYKLASDQDLDGDGIWEIPSPTSLTNYDADSTDTFYYLTWYAYASDGTRERAYFTYYNSSDGWYYTLPEEWLSRILLQRDDTTSGSTVERGVTFYYRGSSEDEPYAVFSIYKNTGTNRETHALTDGRVLLTGDGSTVYSVKVYEGAAELGLTSATVREAFHIIQSDWSEE